MKFRFLIQLFVITIIFSAFVPLRDAVAAENTCTFKAVMNKVHITVWDEDSDQDRQDKIYEGWLESGQRQKIASMTGFIVFSYQQADADRSHGDNHRTCKNGNIIRVP